MNKRLSKILELFHLDKLKDDRRIIVFAICLLIATTLWFLNALSKNYTTTLSYPVKYINPPENQFLANEPPSKFELKVEAYGFTLLRHKLAFSFSPILLNLTYINNNITGNSTNQTLRTEDLTRQISDQVSKEVSIIDISPKIIPLVFDSLKTKMIKVKPVVDIVLRSQFYINDSISVTPDRIKISGPSSILDTINFLKTESENFENVNSNIEKDVNVLYPENTTVNPGKIKLNIPVEKFTEKKLKIPIEVRSTQNQAQVKLFPPQVTVSFMVSLNEYKNITAADFKAFVEYPPEKKELETLEVSIEPGPQHIQMLRITPVAVEFLIETD